MWQLNPYAPFIALVVVLSLSIGAWVRARGRSRITQALLMLIACLVVDSIGLVWDLSGATMPLKRVGVFLQYAGFSFLPVAGLNFALIWSGREFLNGRRWLLALPSVALILGWLTNHFHHAVEATNALAPRDGFVMRATEAGWGFWLFTLYAYVCVAWCAGIYIAALVSGSALSKSQARLLLGGTFVPWLTNVVFLTGWAPDPALDVTVFGHVGMVAMWALALTRGQMLELIPAARNLVFEKLGDPVVVLDAQGRVLDSNEAFRALAKLDARALTGAPLSLFSIDDAEWKRDGRTFAIGRSRLELHRGAAAGEVISLRDVSERVAAEAAQRAAADEAHRLAKARADFLARMSHEVRTPLYGVLGAAELALEHELPDEVRELLRAVQRSGDSLVEIVDEVLDFSRVDEGRLRAELRAVDLHVLVDDVRLVFEATARSKNTTLRVERPGAPCVVRTDESRLRQVLSNLVSNALKFTEAGEVVVGLVATAVDAQRVELEFTVSDTGIGISPEAHQRIFEPFAQADASISRRYGGSGLGLSIAQRLLQLLGGTLSVSSVPGQGSRFTVRLVAERAEKPEVPPTQPRASSREGQVLVVDDHHVSRQLSRAILEREGCHVQTVSCGEDAIAAALERQHALILLDLRMPDLEGPEVLRRLREAGVETPVVWFTADAVDAARLSQQAQGLLRKPFRQAELREVLDRFVVRSVAREVHGEDLTEAFSASSARELEAVAHALAQGSMDEVRALLHGLQGSAALMGAHELSELCMVPLPELPMALPRLREARERALQRLRQQPGAA